MNVILDLMYQTRQPAKGFGIWSEGARDAAAQRSGLGDSQAGSPHQFAGMVHATLRVIQKKFREAVNFGAARRKMKKTSRAHAPEVLSEFDAELRRLPAVPAIAAVATISAIAAPPTTAPPTPITTAASATTVAAAATAATAALSLRTRFVDHQVPAAEILPIESGDRAIGVFIVCNFDERKTPRLPREAIANQIDRGGAHAQLSQPFLQLFFSCGKREITDIKLLHLPTPSARNQTAIAERTERPVRLWGKPEGVPRAGWFSGPGDTLEN